MKHCLLICLALCLALGAVLSAQAQKGTDIVLAQMPHQQRPEDTRSPQQYQADCAAGIALSSCGPIPVSKNCAPGMHWSLQGASIAHCILDDMECQPGSTLKHDNLGSPFCEQIVCEVGKEIKGNECVLIRDPQEDLLQEKIRPKSFQGIAFGGLSYTGNSAVAVNIPASSGYAKLNMVLDTRNGRWLLSATSPISPDGCCHVSVTPESGTWTTMPVAAFQYRISSMIYGPRNRYLIGQPYNINDGWQYWNGITTYPAGPTGWLNLQANSLVSVAGINMDLVNGCSYVSHTQIGLDVQFTLQLREVAQPTLVSTTVFDLVFHPNTTNTNCSADG